MVTGASGFIGRHLVGELIRRGYEVTALARARTDVSSLGRDVRLARGDVTDPDSLRRSFHGHDTVFHLAAVVGRNPGDWENHQRVGVTGTANVLAAAADAEVSRFVHLSSAAVHKARAPLCFVNEDSPLDDEPEPWNDYVRQKVLSERLVWAAHHAGTVNATAIRPPTALGPGDANLAGVIQAIMSSPLGQVAQDGGNRVPVVVVEELARGIADAAASVAAGKVYYLAGTEQISKDRLLGHFRACGLGPLPRGAQQRVGIGAVVFASRILGLVGPFGRGPSRRLVSRLEERSRRRAQHDCVIDCSLASADLGWQGAADYGDAIERAMEWHHAQVSNQRRR